MDNPKYLADGREVDLLASTPAGHIVQEVYEHPTTEEPCFGDKIVVDKVFDEPPVVRLNAEIAEREKTRAALNLEISELRQLIRDTKKEREEALTRVSQKEALKRLDDFLAGKITHLVEIQYSEVKIVERSAALCESDSGYYGHYHDKGRCKLKLLTLFGEANGDLSWQLNQYKDGSGSYRQVFPCLSMEEAREVAERELLDLYEKDKIHSYFTDSILKSFVSLQLPVPEGLADKVNAKKIANAIAARDEHASKLALAQESLNKLSGVTTLP